jgi:hypothetical protein
MANPLVPHDLQSAVWVKLSKYLTARLEDHRARLEGDLDEKETTRLRARIAECKAFLALADILPAPEQVADD